MEGKREVAIGIELGLNSSCVAVYRNDRVEVIPNDIGYTTTPSYVAFDGVHCFVGDAALNQASINPSNIVFHSRRLIGRKYDEEIVQRYIKDYPFKVVPGVDRTPLVVVSYKGREIELTPVDISAIIIAMLKEVAEAYLCARVTNAVITVPACFNYFQIQETKRAAAHVGFDVTTIISEPTAAVMAYDLDKGARDGGIVVMVVDLGTDSCVISLVKIENYMSEVVSVCEDNYICDENFVSRLVYYFVDKLMRVYGKNIRGNPRAMNRLRTACEKAKIRLYSAYETSVEIDALFDGIDVCFSLNRALFGELNNGFCDNFVDLIFKCLAEANLSTQDVGNVVLVGEGSNTPMIRQILENFFDVKIRTDISLNEVVASGAAVHAATFRTHPKETTDADLLLKDVNSLLTDFGASKPDKLLLSHLKSEVKDTLIRLKHNFSDTELLQNLSELLTEVDISLPVHLRAALRGLEQALVSCQHRLLELDAEEDATYIGPQEAASMNADLTTRKKNIETCSSYCDTLKEKINGNNATIERLMKQNAQLERDLASEELKLDRLTATTAAKIESAKARLNRVSSYQNAEKSLEVAIDCLNTFCSCL